MNLKILKRKNDKIINSPSNNLCFFLIIRKITTTKNARDSNNWEGYNLKSPNNI